MILSVFEGTIVKLIPKSLKSSFFFSMMQFILNVIALFVRPYNPVHKWLDYFHSNKKISNFIFQQRFEKWSPLTLRCFTRLGKTFKKSTLLTNKLQNYIFWKGSSKRCKKSEVGATNASSTEHTHSGTFTHTAQQITINANKLELNFLNTHWNNPTEYYQTSSHHLPYRGFNVCHWVPWNKNKKICQFTW